VSSDIFSKTVSLGKDLLGCQQRGLIIQNSTEYLIAQRIVREWQTLLAAELALTRLKGERGWLDLDALEL